MSFLRGSANYVWCTTSVLGKGATGAVFQGVNKHNGEAVAVKTFNQLSHMRPQEVQMREFEVLQKVNHENIVKLLAIEEEQEGRGKVIIMELCTGGSLFNLLDDPENNFGLDEDEWLLVLSHLSAGMNHLRDNHLVHRDLKPGNIMKFIKDDGAIVYKLTDFGAARELQDDQQFVSLYGTEEYLHPDMYERAVLRKPVGKTFGATVDLWSIGVTLYHVATGNLPFRPFGGRRNKETMYHITTKKSSGVISGVQTSENGPIQWNRELPSTCLLSAGIKKYITPLLAGLLEVNPQKMWSFEKFFSEVTKILNKKKVHVFFANKLTHHRVYMDKLERIDDFQLQLTEQTGVDGANQILLHQENFLTHQVEPTTPGTSFPDTTRHEPIILFCKDNNNVTLGIDKDLPTFPALPNLVSVENDATLAKSACAVGYAYRRKIETYSLCSEAIGQAIHILAEVISSQLEKLQDTATKCKSLTKMTETQLQFLESSFNGQLRTFEILLSDELADELKYWKEDSSKALQEDSAQYKAFLKQLNELSPAIQQLYNRYVKDHQLLREWKEVTRETPSLISSAAKAKTYVGKLKESWQHLLRDRASRTLTYNDEQFHILEKIKMQETIRVLVDLLQKNCQPVINSLTELLADWYKLAQTTFLQVEILQKDILSYEDQIETFSLAVKTSHEKHEALLNELQNGLKEKTNSDSAKKGKSATNGDDIKMANGESHAEAKTKVNGKMSYQSKLQIRKVLRSILNTQDEVWGIMNENSRLIEQFGQLAMTSASADGDGGSNNLSQIHPDINGSA